jgi:hypothetical protein
MGRLRWWFNDIRLVRRIRRVLKRKVKFTKTVRRTLWALVFLTLGVGILLVSLVVLIKLYAEAASLKPKDRLSLSNEALRTFIQFLGGSFFLFTTYFTWKNIKLTEEGIITDRFTKSIEQLGNDKLQVRLGGIYALQRIARDSEPDFCSVIEILTAYVRESSSYDDVLNQGIKLKADIQIVLDVIKNLMDDRTDDKITINLKETYLNGLYAPDIFLKGSILEKTHLESVCFERANLQGSNLQRANIRSANLWGANLEGANLKESYLIGAILKGAFLERANLWGAHLENADLQGADLSDSILWEAKLQGANLRDVKGLTSKQIAGAQIDEKTQLPSYLLK